MKPAGNWLQRTRKSPKHWWRLTTKNVWLKWRTLPAAGCSRRQLLFATMVSANGRYGKWKRSRVSIFKGLAGHYQLPFWDKEEFITTGASIIAMHLMFRYIPTAPKVRY